MTHSDLGLRRLQARRPRCEDWRRADKDAEEEDGVQVDESDALEFSAVALRGIPLELVRQVAQYLDGTDLVRLAMCSKTASAMVHGWSRLWREQVMTFELGREAELVLRGEHAMAWPLIYARLWCHENKRCLYCAQPCKRPELPTKVLASARPLCLWAKRLE